MFADSNERLGLLSITTRSRDEASEVRDQDSTEGCCNKICWYNLSILQQAQKWGIVLCLLFLVIVMVLGVIMLQDKETRNNTFDQIFTILGRKSRPGRYSRTQVLGFQIYTGAAPTFKNTDELNEECQRTGRYGVLSLGSEEPRFQCYVGLENPIADAQQRLRILQDAVERAYSESTNDMSVLKIFIAPEFFFRGIDGAYDFTEDEEDDTDHVICGPVCTVLSGLEAIVADKRFEDWFFVFGTVVAYDKIPLTNYSDSTNTEDDDNHGQQYDYMFYNFAPIYKGYDPKKTNYVGKRFFLPKRYTSKIDFLTPQRDVDESWTMEVIDTTLPMIDETLINPYIDSHQDKYNVAVWTRYKDEITTLGYTLIEYDWIIVDDIVITIEICFDHHRARALDAYTADIITGSTTRIPSFSSYHDQLSFVPIPKYQAQISIVSSAGMSISTMSLALTNNGTIYLQDGLYDDPLKITWLKESNGRTGKRISETVGGYEAIRRSAVISPTDVFFEFNIVSSVAHVPVYQSDSGSTEKNDETHQELWKKEINGTFSTTNFEPRIVVWGIQDIPEVPSDYK